MLLSILNFHFLACLTEESAILGELSSLIFIILTGILNNIQSSVLLFQKSFPGNNKKVQYFLSGRVALAFKTNLDTLFFSKLHFSICYDDFILKILFKIQEICVHITRLNIYLFSQVVTRKF